MMRELYNFNCYWSMILNFSRHFTLIFSDSSLTCIIAILTFSDTIRPWPEGATALQSEGSRNWPATCRFFRGRRVQRVDSHCTASGSWGETKLHCEDNKHTLIKIQSIVHSHELSSKTSCHKGCISETFE